MPRVRPWSLPMPALPPSAQRARPSAAPATGLGAGVGAMYGAPHALSWSQEQLVGQTRLPRAASASFVAQMLATKSSAEGSAVAL